jgi:hypothetical protein
MPTVIFSKDKFLPSFDYIRAQMACENLNKKRSGWNVSFSYNGGCTFSTDYPIDYYDFHHAVSAELKDYFTGYAAKFGAMAYTQGNHIFLEPGQKSHLAHEAWHVAQQKPK